jgi:hypothetical protein
MESGEEPMTDYEDIRQKTVEIIRAEEGAINPVGCWLEAGLDEHFMALPLSEREKRIKHFCRAWWEYFAGRDVDAPAGEREHQRAVRVFEDTSMGATSPLRPENIEHNPKNTIAVLDVRNNMAMVRLLALNRRAQDAGLVWSFSSSMGECEPVETEGQKEIRLLFGRAAEMIKSMRDLLQALVECVVLKDDTLQDVRSEMALVNFFRNPKPDRPDELRTLLMYIMHQACRKDLRRHGDMVYRMKTIDIKSSSVGEKRGREERDRGMQTVDTHAWVQYMELRKFIYETCSRTHAEPMWELLHSSRSGGFVERLLIYFDCADDQLFPKLDRENMRNCHSFLDGVYDGRHDMFYPYDSTPGTEAEWHEKEAGRPGSSLERWKELTPEQRKEELLVVCFARHQGLAAPRYTPAGVDTWLPRWQALTAAKQALYGMTPPPPSVVSCKFISAEFMRRESSVERGDPDGTDPGFDMWEDGMSNPDDWYDLPTPALQSIFDSQEFWHSSTDPADRAESHQHVCRMLYVLLGRLLYRLGDLDKWQVILFIKGIAGSGKSTIGKMVKSWFDPSDVGILSNNVQTQFALADICDKQVFLCFEVKANFKLDQAELQSMIANEDVAIARKHKGAITKVWDIPGIFFGNESGPWHNSSNSISRRMAVVNFGNPPKAPNPNLEDEIKLEAATTIFKVNRAYLWAVRTHGPKKDIWKILGERSYFKNMQDAMKESTSPITSFLRNCIDLEHGEDYYVPLQELSQLFRKFCQQNGFDSRVTQWNEDMYCTAFKECRPRPLEVEEAERQHEGKMLRTKYVRGVRIVQIGGSSGGDGDFLLS